MAAFNQFQQKNLVQAKQEKKERYIKQLKILINKRIPQLLTDLENCKNKTTRQVKIQDTKELLEKLDQMISLL